MNSNPTDLVNVDLEYSSKTYFGQLDIQRLHPQLIFLYCNFITPLMIGSTFGQLLQMIPYYTSYELKSKVMKYEAQHLDFIPLALNDPTTLQFELRDAAGNFIYFEDMQREILMTLVFRERSM